MGSQRVRHNWATELNWFYLRIRDQKCEYINSLSLSLIEVELTYSVVAAQQVDSVTHVERGLLFCILFHYGSWFSISFVALIPLVPSAQWPAAWKASDRLLWPLSFAGWSRPCYDIPSEGLDTRHRIYCCHFLPLWRGAVWTSDWNFYHRSVLLWFEKFPGVTVWKPEAGELLQGWFWRDCVLDIYALAASDLGCGMRGLQLQHMQPQLRPVGSSSLTGDGTLAPCMQSTESHYLAMR